MDNWTVSDVTGHAGVIGQYLVFQINQSEDSSKITIMRPVTSASNYISVQLQPHHSNPGWKLLALASRMVQGDRAITQGELKVFELCTYTTVAAYVVTGDVHVVVPQYWYLVLVGRGRNGLTYCYTA